MSAWRYVPSDVLEVTRWTSRCRATNLAGSRTDGDVAGGICLPVEEQSHLDLGWRVPDSDAEEESVELGFG